jgi:hypothetical protein
MLAHVALEDHRHGARVQVELAASSGPIRAGHACQRSRSMRAKDNALCTAVAREMSATLLQEVCTSTTSAAARARASSLPGVETWRPLRGHSRALRRHGGLPQPVL